MTRSQRAGECELDDHSSVTLKLEGFAREAVEQESKRLGVSVEETVTFAVLYYLADLDSGRIARKLDLSPYAPDHASA